MTLKEFLKNTVNFYETTGRYCRPHIVCNDGFSMSIQGGLAVYSDPRIDTDWYKEMEIGFPSEKESLIMEYAESPENPTDTVYGYVPIEIIEQVIEKHGGINELGTFKIK